MKLLLWVVTIAVLCMAHPGLMEPSNALKVWQAFGATLAFVGFSWWIWTDTVFAL